MLVNIFEKIQETILTALSAGIRTASHGFSHLVPSKDRNKGKFLLSPFLTKPTWTSKPISGSCFCTDQWREFNKTQPSCSIPGVYRPLLYQIASREPQTCRFAVESDACPCAEKRTGLNKVGPTGGLNKNLPLRASGSEFHAARHNISNFKKTNIF